MSDKVFLISPPANEPRMSYPYSLVYLSSYLNRNGLESEIIDCDVLGYSNRDLVARLAREKAKWIGITGYSRYRFYAYRLAEEIKESLPHCTLIAGGRHFSSLAEETLSRIPEIDIIVMGEGEITLKETIEALANGHPLNEVAGLAFRTDGRIVSTGPREVERDLESLSYRIEDLPTGPYHLNVDVSLKKSHEIQNPISVMTSRGCPGRCVYCCLSAGRVRFRDPIAVVDEIEQKAKLAGTNELGISDSSFTANKKHVISICDEILRRNLRLKWSCQSRVNIDVEILRLMKEAGCVELSVGVESASPRVLRAIQKKINLDQVMTFLETCKQTDLSVLTYFMVSLPEETEEDARITFKFIKEISPLIFKPALQIAQVYPDARLYYMAKEKGLLPKGFDWFKPYENPEVKDLGGRENIPFYFENLSLEFLRSFINEYKQYYFTHFYYKEELGRNVWQGARNLLFDWKNESLYRKTARLRNGFRAIRSVLAGGR